MPVTMVTQVNNTRPLATAGCDRLDDIQYPREKWSRKVKKFHSWVIIFFLLQIRHILHRNDWVGGRLTSRGLGLDNLAFEVGWMCMCFVMMHYRFSSGTHGKVFTEPSAEILAEASWRPVAKEMDAF